MDEKALYGLLEKIGRSTDLLGKYDEAEEMHRQTLELSEKVLGQEHPSTLDSMNNLALVLDNQGKYNEAEEIHRQTLELSKKVLGQEHPSSQGRLLTTARSNQKARQREDDPQRRPPPPLAAYIPARACQHLPRRWADQEGRRAARACRIVAVEETKLSFPPTSSL